MLAIDFETHLISAEATSPRPVCLSWYDGAESGIVVGMNDMERTLQQAFERRETFIAHNATFELLTIYTHFPNLRPYIWPCLEQGRFLCTKLGQQLHNNIVAKQINDLTLAGLVKAYLDIDISECKKNPNAWRLRYSELDGIDLKFWPQPAIDYAIEDSIYAYQVYEYVQHRDLAWNTKCEFALNLMAAKGMLIDESRVLQLEQEILDYLEPRYQLLQTKGLITRDKGKTRKRMKHFREYIIKNIKKPRKTVKGIIETSNEALTAYQAELPDDEVIQAFREISAYEKALSAFVVRLKEANPTIKTSYNAVVSSGRTSSRSSTHYPSVNIQQMPRGLKGVTWDIRNCFIPRPGYKIVSIDYNGLELTSTAHQLYKIFGRSKMKDTVNSGQFPTDMHSKFACKIKNCTYEEFLAHKKEPEYKRYRQLAKPINLGFPGGIGYDTMRGLMAAEGIYPGWEVLHVSTNPKEIDYLVKRLKFTYPYIRKARLNKSEYALVYDELVKYKQLLFQEYPELGQFLGGKHEDFMTGETRWMKDEWGEWKEEPMYAFELDKAQRDNCTYTAFCNGYLMQSPAAMGAKEMVYKCVKEYRDSDEVHLLAFIHDEIVFEVLDNENKYEHIHRISEIMIDEMQKVLYTVRVAVEAEEMDYWKKDGGDWSKIFWKDVGNKELKSE